jgi:hypothetical protein
VLPFTVIGWAGGLLGEKAPPYGAARREHPQQQVADPDLAIATLRICTPPAGRCSYIIAAWMDAVPAAAAAAAVPPISAMPRLRDEIEFALAIVPAAKVDAHTGRCIALNVFVTNCYTFHIYGC